MKNTVLVYDDNCPLCACYTSLFVKTGFLKEEERQAFSTVDEKILAAIDFEKGKNEIPFVDMNSGKAVYGIDALLSILDRKIPLVKTVGNIRPVKWMLKKAYRFISYNRKVVVAKKCGTGAVDCAPDFNVKYRILFMCFFLILNTALLFPAHHLLSILPYYNHRISDLQTAHFCLVAMNLLLAFTLSFKNAIEYLGQVNMLATLVTLLLVPLISLSTIIPSTVLSFYLVLLTFFIFHEYLRRMEFAGILTSHKWVAGTNLAGISFFILYLFNS